MAKTFCRIPQAPLLFLALLLIASFYVLSLDFSVIFDGEHDVFFSSHPKRSRTLLQTHEEVEQQRYSTMNLIHQDQTDTSTHAAAGATRKEREFGMAAHEVPSGPNPISNR